MANLLCLYENRIPTVNIVESIFHNIKKADNRFGIKTCPVYKVNNKLLSWSDMICIIRPNNAVFGRIAKLAHRYEKKILFFLDDDLLHLPKGNADMPWRKRGLVYSAKQSDVIISFSPFICRDYLAISGGDRCLRIDTPVSKESIINHNRYDNKSIKIVYAASPDHKGLFEKFIQPILKKIDEKYGNSVSLTLMGVHPDILVENYNMHISFIDSLPFEEYRKRIASENFDLGLAPLISDEFTKCKHYNKFLEYSMMGIVGLYSKTAPYTLIVEDNVNGFLVEDSPENWLHTLSYAVDNPELVSKCRENAYCLLEEKFNPKTLVNNIITTIPEFLDIHVEKRVNKGPLLRIKAFYALSRIGDWIYKGCYFLKRGGIKAVYAKLKNHFYQ